VTIYVLAAIGYSNFVLIFGATSVVALVIWACILINLICEEVEDQTNDLCTYEKLESIRDAEVEESRKDKKSYEEALVKYKDEVQKSLVDSYREFEETLMDKVKDSKLIAMMVEKSGYASVLEKHHSHVISLSEKISKCDTNISGTIKNCEVKKAECIKRMLSRQNKGIYGYHYFFPKNLLFHEKSKNLLYY